MRPGARPLTPESGGVGLPVPGPGPGGVGIPPQTGPGGVSLPNSPQGANTQPPSALSSDTSAQVVIRLQNDQDDRKPTQSPSLKTETRQRVVANPGTYARDLTPITVSRGATTVLKRTIPPPELVQVSQTCKPRRIQGPKIKRSHEPHIRTMASRANWRKGLDQVCGPRFLKWRLSRKPSRCRLHPGQRRGSLVQPALQRKSGSQPRRPAISSTGRSPRRHLRSILGNSKKPGK